jgi:hypothetical protein
MEMIQRGIFAQELERVEPPSRWLEWANSRGVPHPAVLVTMVAQWDRTVDHRDKEIETLRTELNGLRATQSVSDKALGTRERESLYKMILGMAVVGYRYKPSASRNSAIAEIATDLVTCDLSLTDDTIRSYLQQAVQALDRHDL